MNTTLWFVFSLLLALASSLNYQNPIIAKGNTPDPGAIYVPSEGRYYVATTSNDNNPFKFPIHSSKDLVDWTLEGYIFPNRASLPSWSMEDYWAPEIHHVDGHYVAYFAARNKQGVLCVGGARSKGGPLGPYVDRGSPLASNISMGNIDPTFYYDNTTQTPYLIWKEDGNGHNPPVPTNIYIQRLSKSGLDPIGDWTSILRNNNYNSWEGNLVEGPWMMKRDDTFYLFYSANDYATAAYAIGVAQSKNLFGPYVKYENNPIVQSDNTFKGPGHCSVLIDHKTQVWFFIYHAYDAGEFSARHMFMDGISWSTDRSGKVWPVLLNNAKGPSHGSQPVP